MAFFRGGINSEGAHDHLGKEIALAGKEWVKECYRWADLEAYQFRSVSLCCYPQFSEWIELIKRRESDRLMLEYGRLYTDETVPGSNDFTGDE
jgi:hypothetical protein